MITTTVKFSYNKIFWTGQTYLLAKTRLIDVAILERLEICYLFVKTKFDCTVKCSIKLNFYNCCNHFVFVYKSETCDARDVWRVTFV